MGNRSPPRQRPRYRGDAGCSRERM
jgi:hypothetical protein